MFPHFAGPMARDPFSISPEVPISFFPSLLAIVGDGVVWRQFIYGGSWRKAATLVDTKALFASIY